MKAIVKEIQIGGYHVCTDLRKAFATYLTSDTVAVRPKINFSILLPSGETRSITIREEGNETVVYGDFEGLPTFLDYAKEVLGE